MRSSLDYAPLEIKLESEDAGNGFIAGWASTPSVDSYKDIVAAGAFSTSMTRRGLQGSPSVKLLLDHEASTQSIAGSISVLEYRTGAPNGQTGLWLEGHLDLDNPMVKVAYGACKKTGGLNFSVGFRTLTWAFDEEKDVLTVLTADLREISIVVFPANEDCAMLVVKSAAGLVPKPDAAPAAVTMADFEKRLIAMGFVEKRADAHRIVLEARAHAHLFRKPEDALGAEAVIETPPSVVDSVPDFSAVKAKADELTALLERFG